MKKLDDAGKLKVYQWYETIKDDPKYYKMGSTVLAKGINDKFHFDPPVSPYVAGRLAKVWFGVDDHPFSKFVRENQKTLEKRIEILEISLKKIEDMLRNITVV